MGKKQHRLNRFGEAIRLLVADRSQFHSERELARRFNRTNSYIRRWQAGEAEPRIEDYEALSGILKINSVDELLKLLDGDRDIEEFFRLDINERNANAKTASAILAIADALRSIAFSLDPTKINYTSADIQECNVTTFSFDRKQKIRLATLLRESAKRYDLDLQAAINQINIPADLAQEIFVFPSPGLETFVAEPYLARMLPYLFQVDRWDGDRPIFRFPLSQYSSVEELVRSLKGNGVGV